MSLPVTRILLFFSFPLFSINIQFISHSLSDNSLTSLPHNVFHKLPSLSSLFYLPLSRPDFFLIILVLNMNQLVSLPSDIFNENRHLSFLFLFECIFISHLNRISFKTVLRIFLLRCFALSTVFYILLFYSFKLLLFIFTEISMTINCRFLILTYFTASTN